MRRVIITIVLLTICIPATAFDWKVMGGDPYTGTPKTAIQSFDLPRSVKLAAIDAFRAPNYLELWQNAGKHFNQMTFGRGKLESNVVASWSRSSQRRYLAAVVVINDNDAGIRYTIVWFRHNCHNVAWMSEQIPKKVEVPPPPPKVEKQFEFSVSNPPKREYEITVSNPPPPPCRPPMPIRRLTFAAGEVSMGYMVGASASAFSSSYASARINTTTPGQQLCPPQPNGPGWQPPVPPPPSGVHEPKVPSASTNSGGNSGGAHAPKIPH